MDRFRQRARELRADQTSAEDKLWRALRNRAVDRRKFRRQHPIDRFIVDFVCIEAKLVVEVDGATHSTERELARDEDRRQILESCGYHVMRVTNDDVYKNLEGVLDSIWLELNHRVSF